MTRRKETKRLQAVECGALTPDPTPHQIKLMTTVDCRREMARVYRAVKAGQIEVSDGTRLIYMLAQIAKLTTEADGQRVVTLPASIDEFV